MICKNCKKEHDGTYGSGLFCSKHCRYSYIGKQVKNRKTPFIKGNFFLEKNKEIIEYKCPKCSFSTFSKKSYKKHLIVDHNNMCDYCLESFENPKVLGAHKSKCRKNPNYFKNINNIKLAASKAHKGKKHTQEEKDHLSRKLKDYYLKHPDLVPYKRNHHHIKESYPEKYFKKVFFFEKFPVCEYDYYYGGYFLDIAYPEKKIDIEINGSQHYVDKRIVKHDIKRKQFLISSGWKYYTINWSKYLKLSKSQKINFIKGLKLKILST